jgi:hypothetical protein
MARGGGQVNGNTKVKCMQWAQRAWWLDVMLASLA